MNKLRITNYKFLILLVVSCWLLVVSSLHAAEERTLWWGNTNVGSAGGGDTVPEGYGLTAIGYGSDDKNCTISIKTAPVDFSTGTVDFANKDTEWTSATCAQAGDDNPSPQISESGSINSVVPANHIITGWSWGANTSGGIIGNDGFPADECAYQQYMNLRDGTLYSWGSQYDGSCNERGYPTNYYRMAVHALPGRVIVAIGLSLGNDANVSWLGVTTREIPQPKTAGVSTSANQVNLTPSDPSSTVTISNSNPTNGGSFMVTCNYNSLDLSTHNVSIQCPIGQNITSSASLPITIVGSLPPGTYFGSIDIIATGVGETVVSPNYQGIIVQYTVPQPDGTITPPPPPPPPPTTGQCQLTTVNADGSTSTTNKTINTGGSVTWRSSSNPDGQAFYWYVSGASTQNNVYGGVTTRTDTYTYNSEGVYDVYFVTRNANGDNTCAGGKSNTIQLTVNRVVQPSLPPPPAGVCQGYMGSTPVCYTDSPSSASQVPPGAVYVSECGTGFDATISGRYTCPAGTYWTGSSCAAGSCPGSGSQETPSGDSNMVTAATDGRMTTSQYQCGTEEVEVCEARYSYDPVTRNMFYDPYCYDTTEPRYCTSYTVGGSWQDPLFGSSPFRDIDLKFRFRGTPSVYASRVEFDCTNDGRVDSTVNTNNAQTVDILAQDLCRYDSPGTYTARARALNSHGETAYCATQNCDDTATIIVEAPPVDLSISANWNIPSTEASTPSRFQSRWDYNNDNFMTTADATIVAQVAGRSRSCPSGKDCDFNGNGTVNIGDALAYANYLRTPIKIRAGSSVGGVLSLSSSRGGNIAITSSPSGYAVSPNPVTVPGDIATTATFTVPANMQPGNYTVTFTGTPPGSTSNALNFEVVPAVVAFDYFLSNSGVSNNQVTIIKNRVAGVAEPVILSLSARPQGVAYSLSNGACSPTCTSVITFTIAPNTQPGTYPITVTGSPLGRQTSFNLVVSNNPITSGSCVGTGPSGQNTARLGETVTWRANGVSGGTPPLRYSWTGTNFPTNPAPSTNPFTISYSTIGKKTAFVAVTDSSVPPQPPVNCSVGEVNITFDPQFQEF